MRIAYLISGFSRVYKDTAPLFEENVFKVLRDAGHEVDVYISTWRHTDRGGYPEFTDNPAEELLKYFPNATIQVEENFEYHNRYVSDFYKRWQAWKLMEESEKDYDIVFRDRMDTVHFAPFKLNELETGKDVVIPRYQNDHGKSPLHDWTAFGTKDAMFDYFNIFNKINDVDCETNIRKLGRESKQNDPEYVLFFGLETVNRSWRWSNYETTPYDRHFGNKVHEVDLHTDENGEEFYVSTKTYGSTILPDAKERKITNKENQFANEIEKVIKEHDKNKVDNLFVQIAQGIAGFSGAGTLDLLNKCVSKMPADFYYLEIGTHQGKTMAGASINNNGKKFIGVDNFSIQFGHTTDQIKHGLYQNLAGFGAEKDISIFPMDYQIFIKALKETYKHKVVVYWYDGSHDLPDQIDNLAEIKPFLYDEAFVLIDDTFSKTYGSFESKVNPSYWHTLDLVKKDPEYELVRIFDKEQKDPSDVLGYWNGCIALKFTRKTNV